ncbi:MAG: hypothetical protein CHACPFDD_04184 [Phycisphaerae bacterium]|nr:hypothetical protein [Phycisphaerae bacterium]
MRWGIFVAMIVVVAVVQTALIARLRVLSALDLFLLTALLWGFLSPPREAPIAGWLIGLAQDMCSSDPVGTRAVALGLAAWLVTWLCARTNGSAWSAQLVIAVLAALAASLAASTLVALNATLWGVAHPWSGFTLGLGGAALGALLFTLAAQMLQLRPRGRGSPYRY